MEGLETEETGLQASSNCADVRLRDEAVGKSGQLMEKPTRL